MLGKSYASGTQGFLGFLFPISKKNFKNSSFVKQNNEIHIVAVKTKWANECGCLKRVISIQLKKFILCYLLNFIKYTDICWEQTEHIK